MAERRALLVAAERVVAPFKDTDFKAAIVKGAMTNEAIAYTKRDAAGKALNAIAVEIAAQAQATKERITRTIGSYQGLLIRAQASPIMAVADVFLSVEHNGQIAAITGNLVKLGSDQGVFASIDWQIRDIAEATQRIDAEGVANDQEEAQINGALTLPWDQAERYTAVQAELEALNVDLSKASSDRAAQPPNNSAQDTPTIAAYADTDTLEIVETSDVDATACEAAAMPLLPPAALPEPSDWAAMAAAMAQLATTAVLTAAEEAAITAELVDTVDAEEQTGAVAAEAAVDGLEQPSVMEIQPRIIVLAQADVVRVPRASRSTLVFGSQAHIGLVKGKRAKTTKASKAANAELATTIDVFAVADTPAPLQLVLF